MDVTSESRKKAFGTHWSGDEIYDLIETFLTASRETYASLDAYLTPRIIKGESNQQHCSTNFRTGVQVLSGDDTG